MVTTRSIHNKTDQSKRVELMASLEERVPIVIVDSANLNSAEVFPQIVNTHEESTIISVGPSSLRL